MSESGKARERCLFFSLAYFFFRQKTWKEEGKEKKKKMKPLVVCVWRDAHGGMWRTNADATDCRCNLLLLAG